MINWRLEQYPELGSTSDEVVRRAQAGEAAGLAVLALRQTSARGSRGRGWTAPEGNLNLSILLRPACPACEAGLFSLLAGVAVLEALGRLGAKDLTLKWPNDILYHKAKLAGILIDATPEEGKLAWLSIGIGINLRQAPEIPGRLTASLAMQGVDIAPVMAAHEILASLEAWHEQSAAAIRQAWLAYGHEQGTALEIAYAGRLVKGRFAGLSVQGELLLQRENGVEVLSTGEVLLAGG